MTVIAMWNDESAGRKRIGGFMFLRRALVTTKEEAEKEKQFWKEKGKRVRVQGKRGEWDVWVSLHNESNLIKYPGVYRKD
jgi:hypothetical protein